MAKDTPGFIEIKNTLMDVIDKTDWNYMSVKIALEAMLSAYDAAGKRYADASSMRDIAKFELRDP